jgi:hypothetical protein
MHDLPLALIFLLLGSKGRPPVGNVCENEVRLLLIKGERVKTKESRGDQGAAQGDCWLRMPINRVGEGASICVKTRCCACTTFEKHTVQSSFLPRFGFSIPEKQLTHSEDRKHDTFP